MEFGEISVSLWLFSVLAIAERDHEKISRQETLARAKLELARHPELMKQSEIGRCATSMVMDAFAGMGPTTQVALA